jgi:hypothetical protein
VDLTDPEFWHRGLGILDGMVAEAERLAKSAGLQKALSSSQAGY